jgi:hypothetical protein
LELRSLLNDGPGDADQFVDPEDFQAVRRRDPGEVLPLPVNAGLSFLGLLLSRNSDQAQHFLH